ncbi:MAG: fibronectin type III domain-containing protein [Gammaproteobacteria bacterium]|nr:fibronectin type III domain-containing protein [Gammaproteobacteria bacterium]
MMAQNIIRSGLTKFLFPVLLAVHLMACGGGWSGGSTGVDTSKTSMSAVTLEWDRPLAREDESPLSPADSGGYKVYYGMEEGNYPNSVDVNDGTALGVTLTDLHPGTYYFVITAYDVAGRESEYSPVIIRTIAHSDSLTNIDGFR